MKTKGNSGLTFILIGSVFYFFATFLLLLQDAFRLERLALELNYPPIETIGLQLAQLFHPNYTAAFLLSLALFFLFWGYKEQIRSRSHFFPQVKSLKFLVSLLFFILSFPSLSTDVFDYNNYNRVAFIHAQNPWITPASQFPQDSRIYLGSWTDRPSIYPLVSHLMFAWVHFVFGQPLLLNLIGFKLTNLVLYLIIAWLLNHQQSSRTAFFILNPVILIEFLGNAHHDLLVGLLILSSVIIASRSVLLSSVFWLASVLAKSTSLIFAPAFVLFFASPKRRSQLIKFSLSTLTLAFFLFSLFPSSTLNVLLASLSQTDFLLRSLPFLLRSLFSSTHFSHPLLLAKLITQALFAASLIWIIKTQKTKSLAELISLIFIAFLFTASPMIQPWYLGWVLPLLPLISNQRLKLSLMVLSASTLIHYLIHQVSLHFYPLSPLWHVLMYLSITTPVILLAWPKRNWYTRIIPNQPS